MTLGDMDHTACPVCWAPHFQAVQISFALIMPWGKPLAWRVGMFLNRGVTTFGVSKVCGDTTGHDCQLQGLLHRWAGLTSSSDSVAGGANHDAVGPQ